MEHTSLVFTGDIGFDKYMDRKWEDNHLIDDSLLDFIKSGDHLVVNVEGPLCMPKEKVSKEGVKQLIHTMDPKVGEYLSNLGADIWCLVNNHIMDAGPDGLFETLMEAKAHNAQTIGVGKNITEARKPVIIEDAGGIGIIGVGYQRACRKADENTPGCFSWSELELIKETIDDIKSRCRWCIVVAHAGEEFTSLPSPYTRQRYHEYLKMGADVVVAHHPHVPMNYETVGEKAIFYSLGNFIFDTDYQRAQYNTEKGIVVKLNFSETAFSFEARGLKIDRAKEKIVQDELPLIFEDVNSKEYELLLPLSAKAFVEATKRQQMYLFPEKYSASTSDEQWLENFSEPLRSGRVPGECLDFQIILPIAEREAKKEWELSSLLGVREFILEQLNSKL